MILGAEHPRALAAIRSLGRAGVPVVAVDHDPSARAFRSRFAHTRCLIEPAADAALAFLDRLGRSGGGVLIPTSDRYMVLASRNHEALARHYAMTVPPWPILRRLTDTVERSGVAGAVGLRAPRVFRPRDEGELVEALAGLELDRREYLLRTEPGTAPASARTGRFTVVAGATAEAIRAQCLEIRARAGALPTLIEVIPGGADECVGVTLVVDGAGRTVLGYAVRRRKLSTYALGGRFVHPYEMGANVYCESVHDAEALEAATRLLHHVGHTGTATLEFRRDPRNGGLVLVKVDPRVVRATSLSSALGLDVPRALYRVATGQPVETPPDYPDGVGWIWITPYLYTLWRQRGHVAPLVEVGRLLRRVPRVRAAAWASAGDPLPFVVDVGRMALATARAAARWGGAHGSGPVAGLPGEPVVGEAENPP